MTLIALHAGERHADIITDTWAYSNGARTISHTSKTLVVPHLDMAVATQGDSQFGQMWKLDTLSLAGTVRDFDEFIDCVQPLIAATWAQRQAKNASDNAADGCDFEPSPPVAFHVGYSPARDAFRAVGFASDDDFTPWDIEGLLVTPSPLSVRPSDIELRRYRAAIAPTLQAEDEANLAAILSRPAPPVPTTDEAWVRLAVAARERAMLPSATLLKVLVGGDVHHTHLERGGSVQARVHSFDDTGEEFAAVMSGTLHPVGLAGPCECGSGLTFLACCVAKVAGDPCWCGSGQPLGTCCGLLAD